MFKDRLVSKYVEAHADPQEKTLKEVYTYIKEWRGNIYIKVNIAPGEMKPIYVKLSKSDLLSEMKGSYSSMPPGEKVEWNLTEKDNALWINGV